MVWMNEWMNEWQADTGRAVADSEIAVWQDEVQERYMYT